MESSSGSIIVSKGMQNPFTFKVGQVFTGFGVGCGLGIGVGRPINLGAIPVLNQVMVAARGASDVFSGVGRHVNHSLKMVGAKNIEAGIGCGVGFGHGFGVGLAIKPGVVHQIQISLIQTATKLMMRFGVTPNLFSQSGDDRNPLATDLNTRMKESLKNPLSLSHGSRTEKVISNFLQTPLVEGEAKKLEGGGQLQSENEVIQLVLKQQVVLEKLKEENEKVRKILVQDLKVSPDKFKVDMYSDTNTYTCSDCVECRRRDRRRRK
ncbi:uncharacterized protein LOC112527851 [Cynara cardunculus var. scolymus]|uniref:Uncharacterized protein n=1 Tax=Cynara cardunculus var. scolymus TaxID=59895 RepID=A0A103XRJ1_CYNCS|nr:uncharacterized protein LOC112527851 [Cynara cardunculus var. scolymus]KVH95571.1 hypothetical protein Ccrd_002377 [Cynara cardunculus var. scolymus]